MSIKLEKANIIIIANAHNPSIISPQWLKEKQVISENPKEFINTPAFSLFDSETFFLTVEQQRMKIETKKFDLNNLQYLQSIGINYIKLLPHIPYKALGLNFTWDIECDDKENLPEIGVNINYSNDFKNIFPDHDLNFGVIIHAELTPYLLKLTIGPQKESSLVYDFNYHHDIAGLDENKISELINNFINLYKHSNSIVLKTDLSKGKKNA